MGASGSKDTDGVSFLEQFTSEVAIGVEDEFWGNFLAIPYIRYLGESLESAPFVRQQYENLLKNNRESTNLPKLILQCIKRLEIRPLSQSHLKDAANGIFILRTFLKFIVENEQESSLLYHCSLVGEHETPSSEAGPMENLLGALTRFLAIVPVNDQTRSVHLECASCLLILLSVQLYSDQPTRTFFIYRCVMQGSETANAPMLTQALLRNYISPSNTANSGSLVVDLAAGIWNIFSGKTGLSSQTDSLSDLSVWMLLIFTYHCTNDRYVANPFRRPLFTFSNTPTAVEIEQGVEAASALAANVAAPSSSVDVVPEVSFSIDLSTLYLSLCSTLDNEGSTLLLYTLLHRNANVRTYIMSRTDIELMIVPILKTLYTAGSCGSYHIYMCLVIILIFSEDDLFSKTVHHITLRNITWFTERSLREISLGGLLVLVLLRTIHLNIMTMRDKYLHSNCLASLANMSSSFTNLHPYVCQRLIDLFESLSKKYEKLRQELYPSACKSSEQEAAPSRNSTPTSFGNPDELKVHQYAVLEEGLRTIAETINVAIRYNLRANPDLIYAVLHKKEIFERVRNLSEFHHSTDVLFNVIAHFNNILSRIQEEPTEQMVTAAIVEGSLRLTIPPTKGGHELKFKYIEEEVPENFFLPYVWSLIQMNSQLKFDPANVRTRISD